MKKIIFFLVVSILLAGCKKNPDTLSDSIMIDIEKRDKISIFDIFGKIEIIPLETNDSSLIIDINKIITTDNRNFLFDYKMQKILVFDNIGNFLFNVGNKGAGPEEYLHISDFDIHDSILSFVTPIDGSLFSYDLEGNFVVKKRLPIIQGAYKSLKYIDNDKIAFWTYDYKNRLKIYSISKNIFIKEDMPEEDIIFNSFSTPVFPYKNYVMRTIDNQTYEITLDGDIKKAYNWDFGKLNNDLNKLKLPKLTPEKKMDYAKKIYASEVINYFFSTGGGNSNYIYTQLMRKNKQINIFYNKRNKENYIFEETTEGAKIYPEYWTENYIIGVCPNIDNMKLDNVLPDIILTEEELKKKRNLNELDNPVLIKYYFKKD